MGFDYENGRAGPAGAEDVMTPPGSHLSVPQVLQDPRQLAEPDRMGGFRQLLLELLQPRHNAQCNRIQSQDQGWKRQSRA